MPHSVSRPPAKPEGLLFISLALSILVAMWPVAVSAADTRTKENIAVDWHSPQLTVRVERSAGLSAVLERVCTQTGAQCEGAERAGNGWVGRVTVTGDWNGVVSNLLEGTGLNFITTSEEPGAPARLVILGTATTADKPVAVHRVRKCSPQPHRPSRIVTVPSRSSLPAPGNPGAANPTDPRRHAPPYTCNNSGYAPCRNSLERY